MLKFQWDGSYGSTQAFMGALPRSYEREKTRVMKRFGIETIIDLQSRITSGTTGPGYKKDKYPNWKKFHGLAPGLLQRSKDYVNHIRIDFSDSGFYIYPFGVEKELKSNTTGAVLNKNPQSYEKIAMGLEWGGKGRPPRPHWLPTARRARARFPGVMSEVIQAAFTRARSSGVVTEISGFRVSVDRPQAYEEE